MQNLKYISKDWNVAFKGPRSTQIVNSTVPVIRKLYTENL